MFTDTSLIPIDRKLLRQWGRCCGATIRAQMCFEFANVISNTVTDNETTSTNLDRFELAAHHEFVGHRPTNAQQHRRLFDSHQYWTPELRHRGFVRINGQFHIAPYRGAISSPSI